MIVTDYVSAWPEVEGRLEAAMAHTLGVRADSLFKELAHGRAQLWVAGNLVAVTRVWETDRRVMEVMAVAGNDFAVYGPKLVAEWKEFAMHHGCDALVATGRPGWRKEFKKHGFDLFKITGICHIGAGHA